jgi:hypothetical protein
MSREVDEALERARAHLVRATLEGIEAARALLEAAVRSSGLAEGPEDSITENLQRTLENLRTALRENASFVFPRRLAEPLAEALEVEIKRWERRSQTDEDARPVLRAFLGLRELLWDLGMRREGARTSAQAPPAPEQTTRRRARVQRFEVED